MFHVTHVPKSVSQEIHVPRTVYFVRKTLVPKRVFFHKRDTSLRRCFMTDTYTIENMIHETCAKHVCAMIQGHMCHETWTIAKDSVSREKHTLKTVFYETDMCGKENIFLKSETCVRVCFKRQTYETNRICERIQTHVPNSVSWGRHMCRTCMSWDRSHVPKTICYMRHVCQKSVSWETLVTNIYGHETEAHVPKPKCFKRKRHMWQKQ